MSDDQDQQDIDAAAEHQMSMEEARQRREHDPDLSFWIKLHDETIARQRVEMAKAQALDFALRRIFRE